MHNVSLTLKNGESKEFVAEIEVTERGYKFTNREGTSIEIYKELIQEITVEKILI